MQFKYHKINSQLNTCNIELNTLYLHEKLTVVRFIKLITVCFVKLIIVFFN